MGIIAQFPKNMPCIWTCLHIISCQNFTYGNPVPVLLNGESEMKKTLTKADIVEAIYEETDRNRVDVKTVVEKLLELMKNAIRKDGSLLLSGFGKFEAYEKASRKGRNPQTEESIILPSRKVIVFRLSRKFRSELNPE